MEIRRVAEEEIRRVAEVKINRLAEVEIRRMAEVEIRRELEGYVGGGISEPGREEGQVEDYEWQKCGCR